MPLVMLFAPPQTRFEVVVRKRLRPSPRYVVLVNGEHWYRELGPFGTRGEALRAGHALAAADPIEPDPTARASEVPDGWRRRRSDSHAPRHKWVRRVKAAWQARPWLGSQGGSLNLGLFTLNEWGSEAEWAAGQCAKAFARMWRPGVTVGEVVELLKGSKRKCERVRADLVVPENQRDLIPAANTGPTETAAERRERKARALVTLIGGCCC